MIRTFKQILIGILIGLFILISSFLAYFYFNQDKIVDVLIREINRKVDTRIDVGPVSMSFWERFPNVTIKFTDVIVHHANKYSDAEQNHFIKVQKLYFDLDISTLVSDSPQISKLAFTNGEIYIAVDAQGNSNYDIFNLPERNKDSTQHLQIDAFELNNITLKYIHQQHSANFTAFFKNALLEGTLEPNYINLNLDLHITKNNIIPKSYQIHNNYTWQGHIEIVENQMLDWNGTIGFDDLKIDIGGFYNFKSNQLLINAKPFKLYAPILNRLLKINDIQQIQLLKGNLAIKNFEYRYQNPKNQRLIFTFHHKSTLQIKNKHIPSKSFGRVNYNGSDILLRLNNFDAEYLKSNFHFEGTASYPSKKVEGHISFNMDLAEWNNEFEKLPVTNMSGIIDCQARLNTKIHENLDYLKMLNSGEIGLNNVTFKVRKNHFLVEQVNANLAFADQKIQVDQLSGMFNKNTIKFKGDIQNLPGYLTKDQTVSISGTANSDHFNLAQFLKIPTSKNKTTDFQLTDDIRLDLCLKTNELIHNKFTAHQFSTQLQKYGRRLEIRSIQTNTANGFIAAKGKMLQQKNNEWYVRLQGQIKNVDVSAMFRQMNNFGQTYIKAENLTGLLTAKVESDFVFYPDFRIHPESIYLNTDLTIKEGALINYKTLEALSDYIALEELQHVEFDNLKNQITITNQTINIPYMKINSSALDVGLKGTHTFDNNIDYQISVGLSDILFRKFKRKHQNTKAHKRNNKMIVYVDIQGTTTDYQFSYSKMKREAITPKNKTPKKKTFDIDFQDLK